jgi:hypothetical protein
MRLEFYYDKQKSDTEEVSKLIKKLQNLKKKNIQLKIKDISNIPKDEIFTIYATAWKPSVYKKYKIRRVFGSHRQPGIRFGVKPALLVYENEAEYPTDVYPHDAHGREITIDDFINTIK